AGTIAAVSNNGKGVAGVTWNTKTRIMPIRVLGKGGGTTYDIIQGVSYAAGLENDSGTFPPQPADIINLSLGGTSQSDAERDLYDKLRSMGIIVVAAAGNESSTVPSYPAAYPTVISVSAVTMQGGLAPYSNRGPTIDVAAPGGNNGVDSNGDSYLDGVLSTLVDDSGNPTYSFAQGTSMAAPHVAGVAALMKWLDPNLTADRFRTLLKSGKLTSDLGDEGRDDLFGYGLIDALKAVQNSNVTLPPLLAIDHAGPLDFGAYIDELEFTTRNAGDGEFNITSVTDDADWLKVTPSSLAGSSGTFTAVADRSGLVDGIYGATITLETDTSTSLSIPVTLLQGERQDTGDTGHLYILLLDPQSLQTRGMVAADSHGGKYTFRFSGIAEGEYLLVAGTDLDNDGDICDPGEACGGYPTIERLRPVKVQEGMDILKFGAGFRITFSALSREGRTLPRRGFSRWPQ
ncbi:MAG TPA: peptidase S8, partial [Gammaproteobacteria bacterium]|nr:peptidase S8 [Gammaproteobacteria bacterium]